jgi:Ca2+-binding EF-hand superfamily protein
MCGRSVPTSRAQWFNRSILLFCLTLACQSPAVTAAEVESNPEKIRAELMAKHDRNSDGRLDATEREAMRLERKQRGGSSSAGSGVPADVLADYDINKDGNMDESDWAKARLAEQAILTREHDRDGDGKLGADEVDAMMVVIRTKPLRYARDYFAYMIKYDKNGSGGFDGNEYATAQGEEAAWTVKRYDADGDGALSKEEKAKLQADLGRELHGFYVRFASELVGGGRGGGGGEYMAKQKELLKFDTDGDGLASAEELRQIRQQPPTAQ